MLSTGLAAIRRSIALAGTWCLSSLPSPSPGMLPAPEHRWVPHISTIPNSPLGPTSPQQPGHAVHNPSNRFPFPPSPQALQVTA